MSRASEQLRAAAASGGIAVTAALARVPGLAGRSLWGDEAYSLAFAAQGAGRIVRSSIVGAADVHPPLYYLLLKAWCGLFGGSDLAARSLSLALGCLAAVGVFLLGRQLLGESGGLVAGLIAALSPCFVQTGSEVRMYALLAAAGVFAHLAFARMCGFGSGAGNSGARNADGALWALACLAAVYTHHLGWLVPLSHWGFLAWQRLRTRPVVPGLVARLARLQALVLLLAAPALTGFLRQALTRAHDYGSPLTLAKKLAGVYLHFSMGYHFANFGRRAAVEIIGDPLSLAMLAAGALGAAWFVVRALRQGGGRRDGVALAATLLLVPVALGALFFQLNLGARYLSAAAPGFAVLLAAGLTAGRRRRLFWPAALLLAAANIVSLGTAWRLPTDVVHRENWRAMARHLEERASSGEFVGCDNIIALRRYYDRGPAVLGNAKALGGSAERYAGLGGVSAWVQAGVDGSTPPAAVARLEQTLAEGWDINGRQYFGRDLLLYRLERKVPPFEPDRAFHAHGDGTDD